MLRRRRNTYAIEALKNYIDAAQTLAKMKHDRDNHSVDEIANQARTTKGWREVFDEELNKAIYNDT